jgi:phospholipase/carboxylesterase
MLQVSELQVSIQSPSSPCYRLVLLHGWGANAQDLSSLAPALTLESCEFCFPEAPFSHPYAPNGRMWYDLEHSDPGGLAQSRKLLIDWLQSLDRSEVPLSQTILGGFSQGGAMALDVGLDLPLAGLAIFSGYLHPDLKANAASPRTCIIHGQSDTVVPIAAAQQTYQFLASRQVKVSYHDFAMGHEITDDALYQMRQFIAEQFELTENKRDLSS